MTDSVRVHLRAQALYDHIREVILKIFGYARHKCHAHRGQQQQTGTADELRLGVLVIFSGVSINDVPKNDWVKKRKNLIGGGEKERHNKELPVWPGVSVKKFQGIYAATWTMSY